MYDAVYALGHALEEMDKTVQLSTGKVPCAGDQVWDHGSSLYNYMNFVSNISTTGNQTLHLY